MTRFQKLAVTTVGATVIMVSVGALVRATGSGDACPDWPTCFGRWYPPLRADTLIEWTHRTIGVVVGFLVLALAISAWLRHRANLAVFVPSMAALVAVGVQGWIGGQVVRGKLAPNLVALHFFLAMVLLGLVTAAATGSFLGKKGRMNSLAGHGIAAACAAFVLMMVGAFVSQYGAALVFSDWPLMNGGVTPSRGDLGLLHYSHRAAAILVGAVLATLAYRLVKYSYDRTLTKLGHGLFAIWLAQVLVGGLNVLTQSATWAIVLHVVLAAVLWAASVAFCLISYRLGAEKTEPSVKEQVPHETAPVLEKAKAYFMLTKPRIIELLLITTVPAMILAAKGWPSGWLILSTLIGGTMTAGSANSINNYLDRDIDEKMERTRVRPLPRHQVTPANALRFGVLLGIAGFLWLFLLVNFVAAAFAVGAILFYVFVYTMGMKRTTPSNIVIGGAAGAAPVLVGWAAVTGTIEKPAWVLFAIIFYWTPPHFWALALKYSDQYKAAGVPMLPVVRGVAETTKQIFLYTFALFAVSILLTPVAGMGVSYLASATVLGSAFTFFAYRLMKNPDPKRAMGLFHFSISYLVLLVAAVAVDQLVNDPRPVALYQPILAAAAVLFVAFEGAILMSLGGFKLRLRPPERGGLMTELLWTIIPLLVMAGLFILSWQDRLLASP